MSDESYMFQVSIKHGPGQLAMTNVRGRDAEEFERNLEAAVGKAPAVMDLVGALVDTSTVGSSFPGSQVVNSPQSTSDSTARSCQHGPMKWVERPEYAGHFCPADRNDPTRCKPVYARKGGK